MADGIFGTIFSEERYTDYSNISDPINLVPTCYEEGSDHAYMCMSSEDMGYTHESLMQLAGILADRQSTGGLSKIEAALVNNGVKSIWEQIGVPQRRDVLSVESFDSKSGRISQTTFAFEGIKETLGNWWKAVRDFVRKWINKAKDFYLKYLSSISRLPGACDKLMEAIEKSSATKKESNQLTLNATAFKNLTAETDKVESADIISGLKEAKGYIGAFEKESEVAKWIDEQIKELEGIDFSNSKDVGKLGGFNSAGKVEGFTKDIPATDKRFNSKTSEYKATSVTLGKVMMVLEISYKEETKNTFKWAKVGVYPFKDKLTVKDENKVAPLEKGEMNNTLEAVKDLAKTILECEPEIRRKSEEVEAFMKRCDKVYESIKDHASKDDKGEFHAVGGTTGGVGNTTKQDKGTILSTKSNAAGTVFGTTQKSIADVQALLKGMTNTVGVFVTPYQLSIDQAGKSAKAAYDFTLASFKNLKDE